MAATAVVGGSPLFVLSPDGKQLGIPLSLLAIKDGSVDTSRVDPTVAATVATMANALYGAHLLGTSPAPAPVLALTLKAKAAGAGGNGMSVKISKIVSDPDPTKTKVDAQVVATDKRTGMTKASVGAELGTPAGGTKPSLIVLTGAASKLPANLAATKLAAANPGDPLTLKVPGDGGGTAFTAQAAGADALYQDVTVAIQDSNSGAGTFTLVIAVDHTESGVKLKDLDSKLGALVDVDAGPAGFADPAEGTYILSGGAETQTVAASPAEANVLSD